MDTLQKNEDSNWGPKMATRMECRTGYSRTGGTFINVGLNNDSSDVTGAVFRREFAVLLDKLIYSRFTYEL